MINNINFNIMIMIIIIIMIMNNSNLLRLNLIDCHYAILTMELSCCRCYDKILKEAFLHLNLIILILH